LLSGAELILSFDGANLRASELCGVVNYRDAQWFRDVCDQRGGAETSFGGVCCKTQHASEGMAYDKESIALCCYSNRSCCVLVPTLESIESAGGWIDVPDLNDIILLAADSVESAA
jgi:hypothetical protein